MLRRIASAALIAAVMTTASAATVPANQVNETVPSRMAVNEFRGTLVTAGDDQVILQMDGDQLIFHVSNETEITLNGEHCTLDNLLPGFQATVFAEKGDEHWMALIIEAHSL